MNALVEPKYQQEATTDTNQHTRYIAIGLRQTDRGLRMVRLFTTDTLPRKFRDEITDTGS